MLTGFASVETAINSMKLGAYDYLTKPCKISSSPNVISKAYEKKMLRVKRSFSKSTCTGCGARRIRRQKQADGQSQEPDFPCCCFGHAGPHLGKTGTARSLSPGPYTIRVPGRKTPLWSSTQAPSRRPCLKASFSATRKGPLRVRKAKRWAFSRLRTGGRSSSTKWGIWGFPCRPSC